MAYPQTPDMPMPEWGYVKEPVLYDRSLGSGGAADQIIEVGPVPEGYVWELDHVAVEDKTTGLTSIRVGIVRALIFTPLEEQLSPVAATLYWADNPLHLNENESLRAVFAGSTSGDRLALYVNGVAHRRA